MPQYPPPISQATFAQRILAKLPQRWFYTPRAFNTSGTLATNGVVGSIAQGIASAFAYAYNTLLGYAALQARLATRTDENLDGTSQDFFAGRLPRAASELDPSFSTRIRKRTVAPINTGPGMEALVNDYLAVATPLEQCDVFDSADDPARSETYGIEPGAFAVELYAPNADINNFTPGDAYVTYAYTGISRYRVWGLGNHGLGGSSGCALVRPFQSDRVPHDVVDPNIVALVEDCKADGVEATYRYYYV